MEKKRYSKPQMLIEQFTPQEYVASCWYVAEGDCYTDLFHDTVSGNGHWKKYDDGEYIVENHGSHRIPESGYFNSDETPLPEAETNAYIFFVPGSAFDIYELYPGQTYESDICCIEVKTPVYKFQYNGETHYLKNISYPSNTNATS